MHTTPFKQTGGRKERKQRPKKPLVVVVVVIHNSVSCMLQIHTGKTKRRLHRDLQTISALTPPTAALRAHVSKNTKKPLKITSSIFKACIHYLLLQLYKL
jgi:hypothetical protein